MKCSSCKQYILFHNTHLLSHKCGEKDILYSKELTIYEITNQLRIARKNGYYTVSMIAIYNDRKNKNSFTQKKCIENVKNTEE